MSSVLRIFTTSSSDYHFSFIKKHKWNNDNAGKILAEQCVDKKYDSVVEVVVDNFPNSTDVIYDLLLNCNDDIFFFIEYSLHELHDSILTLIKQKASTTNIFFCCHYEPYTISSFEYLKKEIYTELPDLKNIWFISCNLKVNELTTTPTNLNVAAFDFFSGYFVYGIKECLVPLAGQSILPKKDFLCLNLKPRPNRKFFIDLLHKHEVYENGYISFGGNTLEGTKFDKEARRSLGANQIVIPTFFDISPWVNNVYFEVVMDDVYSFNKHSNDENYIYMSEKVYRTIYNKLPMMVYGKPEYLKYLQALGFKTYNNFFDETYDVIEDWRSRGRMIADQVKRFCQKPDTEKQQWFEQAKEIAEFNYNHLLKDENLCRLFLNKIV